MNNINDYLRELHKKQSQILLVYRPVVTAPWSDRCFYLGEGYDQEKQYNHRLILVNEVVIEFDDDSPITNEAMAKEVEKKLKRDGVRYAMWDSGGKSLHIHFFINAKTAGNIRLLKKVVMRHYTEGLGLRPDMRLAADGHLIRAEFGIHESSGRRKRLIHKSRDYFKDNDLPDSVWQKYANARTTVMRRETSKALDTECDCIAYIANSVDFRENHDGRERALFILIHSLKQSKNEEDLIDFLQDWYKYSGGYKLSPQDIARKVRYHYKRTYGTYTMVEELLEELGQGEVLKRCKIHNVNRSDKQEERKV